MSNLAIESIEKGLAKPTEDRVLIRTVSILEQMMKNRTGEKIILAPGSDSEFHDKNASHYEVIAVGPLCSERIKIGMKILHVSTAADRVVGKYGCIREKYIMMILEDEPPKASGGVE